MKTSLSRDTNVTQSHDQGGYPVENISLNVHVFVQVCLRVREGTLRVRQSFQLRVN